MEGDDAARFDPPAAARQKEDIHPAVLRLGERLLDAGCREYRSRMWRAATAATETRDPVQPLADWSRDNSRTPDNNKDKGRLAAPLSHQTQTVAAPADRQPTCLRPQADISRLAS
jgi:hypothetical protein